MGKDSNQKALTLLLIFSLAFVCVTAAATIYLTLPQRVTQVITPPEEATLEMTVGNYSLLNTSWGHRGFSLKSKVLTTNVVDRNVNLTISQPSEQNQALKANYTKLILHVQETPYNGSAEDFLMMDLLYNQSVTSSAYVPAGTTYFDYYFEWACPDGTRTGTAETKIELLVSFTPAP